MRHSMYIPALALAVFLAPRSARPAPQAEESQTDPADSAAADDTPADPERIAQLVRQLGHRSFRMRQRAARELLGIGIPAQEALARALDDPDAEIRRRARPILAAVKEQAFQERLYRFQSTSDGGSGLAGWDRYCELVGPSRAARRLFADMQEAEHHLIELVEAGGPDAAAALESRALAWRPSGPDDDTSSTPVPLGSIAALVFLGTDSELAVSPQSVSAVSNLAFQSSFERIMRRGGDTGELLKRLLAAWIERDVGQEETSLYHQLMLGLSYELPEARRAAEILVRPGATQPFILPYAILALGKLGDEASRDLVAPHLDDATVVFDQESEGNLECQVRDVALAVTIHLSGQDPRDFGFPLIEEHSLLLYSAGSIGFESEQDRAAAFDQWDNRP